MKNLNPYGLSLCLISVVCWSSLLVYFNRDSLFSKEDQGSEEVFMMSEEEQVEHELNSLEYMEKV